MAVDSDSSQPLDDKALGATLVSGQRVLGRYVLLAELGRGGMGVVWRAHDETLGEIVALKFLPEYVACDPVALDELKQETRRAHRLTHPNIVRVHDFTQDGGLAALSMEYVDGATLTQRRLEQPGRVFTAATLGPLAAQLCAALEYAHHTAKTAHRDLKPANILVTRTGAVKLTDFGISRSLTETRTRLTMPERSKVTGTLPYMSPQQLRGDNPQASDDVYALGATLYELLAGRPPFYHRDMAALMMQIRQSSPPPIAETLAELGVTGDPPPRAWEDTLVACLAKEFEKRPQSAADVAVRIGLNERGVDGQAPVPIRNEQPGSNAASPKRDRRILIAVGAAVILAGGTLLWRTNGAGKAATHNASEPPPTKSTKTIPSVAAKDPGSGSTTKSVAVPETAPEFVVSVFPAEAGARLWLGPFSDLEVRGGRAVLPNLPDGEHELVVQAAGHEPFNRHVTIRNGRGQSDVRLVRVKGNLEITGRPGTRVFATGAAGEKISVGAIGSNGVLTANGALAIGSYVVKLEHDDCEPLEISRVELVVGRVARLALTQIPLPGELQVKSAPAGAEIRVNGVASGRTPSVLRALASEQSLRVEFVLAGYRRAEQNVRLNPREARELDFGPLEPESGGIALRVTNPKFPIAEAEMKVDGNPATTKRTGEIWLIENVAAGARIVEINHRDYQPWKQSVDVRDRQNTDVTAPLAAKGAVVKLDITGPKNYTVLIGGNRVEVVNGSIAVPAQYNVVIEVRATGFRPAIGRITLEANARRVMPIILESQTMPRAGQRHENSVRMRFVPVPGLGVLFSIWETRVSDFDLYQYARKQKSRRPAGEFVPEEPAVAMTWEEAQDFCRWLTEVERSEGNLAPNQKYRLPTDQEWSVAVGLGRETGKTPADRNGKIRDHYPWGKQWPPPSRAGNYAGEETGPFTSMLTGYKDGFTQAAPAGSFTANGFGIFDLSGNVWEWCEDEYEPGTDRRVVRGGSFRDYTPEMLLSSARANSVRTVASPNLGFRCVLETGPAK